MNLLDVLRLNRKTFFTPAERLKLIFENGLPIDRLNSLRAEFDWAERSLKQQLRISQAEPLGQYIYRQWTVEIGAPNSS